MEKRICSNCFHCMMGMKGGKYTYSCRKVRGKTFNDSDGCTDYDDYLKVSRDKKACQFYKQLN